MRGALALLALLALAGCRTSPPERAATVEATPPVFTPPGAPKDPSDLVRRYYAAIEARDYASAYAMWGDGGRNSKQTYAEFARGFAQTAHVKVTITDPVSIEGAAGSSYAEVRVLVEATTTQGATQRFRGAYVARRANDVPGATPEQLRWHFDAARLAPAP